MMSALRVGMFLLSVLALVGCDLRTDPSLGALVLEGKSTLDLGQVPEGQSRSRTVTVRNAGEGSLKRVEVVQLDGSSLFSIQLQPGTAIDPGADHAFELLFSAPAKADSGEYTATFEVKADGAAEGQDVVRLTARANVFPADCAVPEELDFGQVGIGGTTELELLLVNRSASATEASISSFSNTSTDPSPFRFAEASLVGTFQLEPEERREIALRFEPAAVGSYIRSFKVKPAEWCPEQIVKVVGTGVQQTLTWSPSSVDCGYASPGVEVERELTFTNLGKDLLVVSNIDVTSPLEFRTAHTSGGNLDRLIVPGATREEGAGWVPGMATIRVHCKPAGLGPRAGHLIFQSTVISASGSVPIQVIGGGPDIEVFPAQTLNFGKVAFFEGVSTFQTRKVVVSNLGVPPVPADPRGNLQLGSLVIQPLTPDTAANEFEVSLAAGYDPAVGLEARSGRNALPLQVKFTPSSLGAKRARLTIPSNDPDEPVVTLELSAEAVDLPPCDLTISDAALHFGVVAPAQERELSFTLTNGSSSVCLVHAELAPGTDPAFKLINGTGGTRELSPGEMAELRVSAAPMGDFIVPEVLSGAVQLYVSSPDQPNPTIALEAMRALPCLTIAPNVLDFGTVAPGCSSATRTFHLYNACNSQLTLSSVDLRSASGGAASPEFSLEQGPSIPAGGLSLISGSAPVAVSVSYAPSAEGVDTDALVIEGVQAGQPVRYVVPLRARGDASGIQNDVVAMPSMPMADVLLALDDSSCSEDEQQALGNNFQAFTGYANAVQVDYRIAVTTTDNWVGGPAGRFVFGPGHPEKILTMVTPQLVDRFKAKVAVGGNGSGTEMTFAPSLQALTPPLINGDNAGFLRRDASLAVVAMSDEGEQSPHSVTYYLESFWNIKGHHRKHLFSFSVIGPLSSACAGDLNGRYAQIAELSNGVGEALCDPAWTSMVQRVGDRAFAMGRTFHLTSIPDPSSGAPAVRINGLVVPSSTGGWSWDPVENAVTFAQSYMPDPGQTVTFTYPVTCYP